MGNSSSTPCPHCVQQDSSSNPQGETASKVLPQPTDPTSEGTLLVSSSGSGQSQCPLGADSGSPKCPVKFDSFPWFSRRNKPAVENSSTTSAAAPASGDEGSCGCGCVSGVSCAPASSGLDPKNLVFAALLTRLM